MASNFIPMLSSSPPPIDDCPDNEDEDDEFGTFTSANIGFDSSFDSPTSVDKYKSFYSGDNGVNDIIVNKEFSSPTQKFQLGFPSKNQKNHKIDLSQNQSKDELIGEKNSQDSSVEETKSVLKSSSVVTSQNGFAESINNDQGNCLNSEGDHISKLKECNDLNIENMSLDEMSNSVPIVSSEIKNISKNGVRSNYQSTEDLVTSNNLSDPSIEFSNHDRNAANDRVDFASNEMKVNSIDFSDNDSFDGFQAAGVENDPKIVNNSLSIGHLNDPVEDSLSNNCNNDSNVKNLVNSFEVDPIKNSQTHSTCEIEVTNTTQTGNEEFSDFADFQAGEEKCEFTNFQAVEEEFSDFADFQAGHEAFSDFTDFQTSKEESSNFSNFPSDNKEPQSDLSEFDDFQSFDTAPVEVVPNDVIEQESEDFTDFQACSQTHAEQGFANFKAEPFKKEVDPNSSEFADFETASFSSVTGEVFPRRASITSNSQEKTEKLSTVIKAIFPHEEVSSDIDVSCDPALEVLEHSNKSLRLWEKLHEVEQSPNMRLQWSVSHTFQQLLRSVNVDYHSILRTSSVPIFASGLSLLEPVKGQANSVNLESEDRVQTPREAIPPVEFDWNTSGLTNPLDSVQAISTLMDLSFLSPSETKTSSLALVDSFESELLKPSPALTFTENKQNFILEELLSKNVCSIPNSNTTHRPLDLSKEANYVLDQLPDLSFMRAKVLMFPISNQT